MKATPFYRRHPLLCALLLLVVSSSILLVVALSQLDLGELRQRLAQELSLTLQLPVEMEKLHLTYQQGLAINIHNLNIGAKNRQNIQVPQVTGTLRLKPLLKGELLVDKLILTEPAISVNLSTPEETISKESLSSTAENLFKRFGLSLLTVRRATLDLKNDDSQENSIPSRIENLNIILRGWKTEQSGYLVVSGEFPEQAGQFTIETELPPPSKFTDWRMQPLKVKADLKHFSRDLLPETITQHLPEQIDATINLNGTPASGADFSSQFKGTRPGEPQLKADGVWISTERSDNLRNVRINLFDLPLTGDLGINRTDDGALVEGNLQANNIPLPTLLKKWPHPKTEGLVAGKIDTADVQFKLLLGDSPTTASQPFEYQLHLLLEDGLWSLNESHQLEQLSLDIKLDNQTLELTDGKSRFFDQELSFQGAIHNWQEAPLFTFNVTAQPDAASLRTFLPDHIPESLNGMAPTSLTLEGTLEQIRGELQIGLDKLHGELNPLFAKQQGESGLLSLKGVWRAGQLTVEQMKLDFADTHINGTALVHLGEQGNPFQLQLNNIDLTALRPHSPLLQRLKAEGRLNLGLQHKGPGEFQGHLDLEKVGAHVTWVIADINSVSGNVDFNQSGLTFNKLNAHLGQSLVQVDGKLRDWKNFLLELHVRSQAVHARDLVFSNPEMIVHDLDGKLLINKGGIIFDPVHVRLENGTDATVTGYVRDFSAPDTFLEIESYQYADILEVINLFIGPPRQRSHRNAKATESRSPGKPIRILARAAQGTLSGLKFQQAEGMITSHQGLFTLYPLRFKHDDGFCLARVEHEQGRLKVSGHLEDFDASTLYLEVLKAQGLVTGKLRGDFYLEGDGTGRTFWTSSKGGAHLEIRDGVLRKFRGLARVFSLLNVSQLFELKLPDMDSEGMPFTLLNASLKLEEGLISTDNLNIKSNAMNMTIIGNRDLTNNSVDMTVGVKPLRTVDKFITAIPVAGWLLAGEERALLTAHFKVEGPADDPDVSAIPASSLSKTVLGVLKRTLGLPGTLVTDPEKLFFPGRDAPLPEGNSKSQQPAQNREPTDKAAGMEEQY